MTLSQLHLHRMQLSDSLRAFAPSAPAPPCGGWARAIREGLGMTQAQLGDRLGISRQSVKSLEVAEAERRVTLDSLDRMARAMGCRVVYALVPETGTIEGLLERRAAVVAETMLQAADHSMQLEAQGVSARERLRQRKLLTESLLRGSARKLWR